ncbi:tyrosine-protein phosphatase non-receptor type 18 isoform X2 [Ambystoma mexicanum]|uniref:tyrosine-protein phosphatase non-receptor type 18 isoform X2 n=1 Tax=Ambystoma mexicanum TaxID=8296 RepID=UPI0037E93F76
MTHEYLRSFLARVESVEDQANAPATEFQNIRTQVAAYRQENRLTTEIGGNKDNIKKNRYKDILPYDQTRVPLSLLVEDGQSDYINASFIQGLDNKRCYIATQGPLSHTVVDFWRMIWEYCVKVIVMACREVEQGKKKCECYWPKDQEPSNFGPFSLRMVEEKKPSAEVVLRTLQVTFQKEVREITHFQYVAWPDRGIPDSYDCFLEMIRLVRQHQGEDLVPICVHCSAGCGRTGVICTIEYVQNLISKKKVPNNFSIFQIVMEMRQQRPSAVQTKEQYEFLYHAITEMFEKQLKISSTPCYENLQLTEKKDCLYDDVGSLRAAEHRTLPQCARGDYSRSTSFPAEQIPQPSPKSSAWSRKEMNDTYAVVKKTRTGAPRVTSSPASLASRCQMPPSTATQYDNVTPLKNSGGAITDPVYSTVRPKSKISVSPTTQNSEGQKLNGSWTAPPTYSLAGAPAIPEKPQENNYAAIYIHGSVDTSTASSQANTGKGNNKLRNFFHSGFGPAPPKKAVHDRSNSIDSYEDVADPSKSIPDNLSMASGVGFNNRIGRPKGPREPPAEWSRLE